jgi:hypothetical protein
MRKLVTIICLFAFLALQYGKIVSYWHCRITAPVNCDCQKALTSHNEKDHATKPVMIAREKAEEVYLSHALITHVFEVIITNSCQQSHYLSLIPSDHTAAIFQPPKV